MVQGGGNLVDHHSPHNGIEHVVVFSRLVAKLWKLPIHRLRAPKEWISPDDEVEQLADPPYLRCRQPFLISHTYKYIVYNCDLFEVFIDFGKILENRSFKI